MNEHLLERRLNQVGARLLSFSCRESQAAALCDDLSLALAAGIRVSGAASLVLPGGTTPERLLELLADEAVDWSKVTVTLSDGSRQERQLYAELRVQVGDRDDVFSCVAKPEGAPLLLGQIVLEALDLVVDCGQQRLIPNPEAPDGMMLYEDY